MTTILDTLKLGSLSVPSRIFMVMPRTVNGTGHTGPSEFCATSI